jgi:hypothetical protein
MPQVITDVDVLQEYISGVMKRAGHHANNVDEVALAIAGAVVWRKDGDLRVMAHAGDMKNVLWVRINGQRYALSYNHAGGGTIEVRRGSTQGAVLASFNNTTPLADVKRFFESL